MGFFKSDFTITGNVLVKYRGKDSLVILPEDVIGIAAWAFVGCSHLASITIPNRVKNIGT